MTKALLGDITQTITRKGFCTYCNKSVIKLHKFDGRRGWFCGTNCYQTYYI